MNLQVQVKASLCLVLLVIQPVLNQPVNPFTQLNFDESEPDVANIRYIQQRWPLSQQINYRENERERKRTNIRIVQRETIEKSPVSDCDVKITELPSVTFQHPTLIRQIGEPLIVRRSDVDDLPAYIRQVQAQICDNMVVENLLRRLLYSKYGNNLVFSGPRSQPISRKQTLRLPQLSRSNIDVLLAADPRLRRIQVNSDANDEEVILALYPQLRNPQSNNKREELLDLMKASNITPEQYRDLINGKAFAS